MIGYEAFRVYIIVKRYVSQAKSCCINKKFFLTKVINVKNSLHFFYLNAYIIIVLITILQTWDWKSQLNIFHYFAVTNMQDEQNFVFINMCSLKSFC